LADGAMDRLPANIRHDDGPWDGLWSGESKHLRPQYQRALSEVGYIIVEQSGGVFSAEM
jgi:hypothetical protein